MKFDKKECLLAQVTYKVQIYKISTTLITPNFASQFTGLKIFVNISPIYDNDKDNAE